MVFFIAGRTAITGDAVATPPTLLPAVVAGEVDRRIFFVPNLFCVGGGTGGLADGDWRCGEGVWLSIPAGVGGINGGCGE